MQLLRVLRAFGPDHLRDLDRLKYRLCPIVARNEQEQLRFYEQFDTYLQEIQTAEWAAPAPEEVRQWWQKIPRWLWAGLLLAPFAVIIYNLIPKEPPPPLIIQSEHPAQANIGDTVHFLNRSANYDSARMAFQWQLVDTESGLLEDSSSSRDWHYLIQRQGASPRKEVRLIAADTAVVDTFLSQLLIRCSDPPVVDRIGAPERAEVGDTVRLGLLPQTEDTLSYAWSVNVDSSAGAWLEGRQDQASAAYLPARPGVYQFQVEVERVGAAGFCLVKRTHRLVVGGDRAFLEAQPLAKDKLNTLLNFSWGTWLLLALLGLYLLYQWAKWLNPPPPPPDPEREKKQLQRRFASSDKGPYFIPFRDRSVLIRVDPSMYRLADILRQRQEGLRMELDVPLTVRRTVEQGGFPAVQLRHTTVPSEYLFLIDEQAANSHQAGLYTFLARFMRDKDVHVSTYYYQAEFDRFWSDAHPEGVSLERLQRLYPNYRLMILGTAHGLLDSQATREPTLKKDYAKVLRRWKNRMLLTPLPAVDWTYRESALYGTFPVFPGDVEGFQSAMAFLELALAEEDEVKPGFSAWQANMMREHPAPNTNYRRWNRLATYRDYLRDYPSVYQWLCALAVYPAPIWAMTIAIGRALEPKGVEVNFENLLLLSRIPWLQGQPLSPKLRFELLKELDAESEALARRAVKEELEAVAPLVANSHANAELQTNLVITNFVMDPHEPANRRALRHLEEQGLINKKQRAELDVGLERRPDIPENDLEAFLRRTDEPAPQEERRVELQLNHHFYKALFGSLLFLLIGIGVWRLGATNEFYRLIFGEDPRSISADSTRELRDYFFIRETTFIDSAIVYNNAGVDLWRRALDEERQSDPALQQQALGLFQRAIDYRQSGNYLLGRANKGRLHYQIGMEEYHRYLESFSPRTALTAALPAFRAAAGYEATLAEGLHGQGLVFWYESLEGRTAALDSANHYYRQLEPLGFFDTLSLRPNLETLLFPDRCPGPVLDFDIPESAICDAGGLTITNRTMDAEERIQYYTVDWGDGQTDSLATFESLRHDYRADGCNESGFTLRIRAHYQCLDGRPGVATREEAIVLAGEPQITATYGRQNTYCVGESVRFTVTSPICEGARYTWDFGDGSTSEETNPSHTYARAGDYTIRGVVTNACGETSTTLNLRVNDCGVPVSTLQIVALDANTQQPIAGAQVRWPDGSGLTGRNGAYQLTYPSGRYEAMIVTATAPGYDSLRREISLRNAQQQQVQQFTQRAPEPQVERLYLQPTPKEFTEVFTGLEFTTQDQAKILLDVRLSVTPGSGYELGDVLPFLENAVAEFVNSYNLQDFQRLNRQSMVTSIRTRLEGALSKNDWKINNIEVPQWEVVQPATGRAEVENDGVRITIRDPRWESAAQYQIDRSANGVDFETIRTFPQAGASERIDGQAISYLDRNVETGVNYYRVRRFDQNGSVSLSEVFTANWEPPAKTSAEPLLDIQVVVVPGGEFVMGCDEKLDGGSCPAEEKPARRVSFPGFAISKYEITNAQFAAFLNANIVSLNYDGNQRRNLEWYDLRDRNARIEERQVKAGGKLGGTYTVFEVQSGYETHPVTGVTFYGAQAFCEWLSKETGQSYRLPTEAEWEYAARGGAAGAENRYPYAGGPKASDAAWYSQNAQRRVHSIAETNQNLQPNALGIYNMSGNVYEWCLDCWNPNYRGAPENGYAREDGDCSIRVIRGGAWNQEDANVRVLHRGQALPDVKSDYIGFRVVVPSS